MQQLESLTGRRQFLLGAAGSAALATATAAPVSAAPARSTVGVFNVRNFGARGNGKADDTASIRRALSTADSNATVYFPSGDYVISAPLDLLGGQAMVGDPTGSVIHVRHFDAPAVHVPFYAKVSNLTFSYDNTDYVNPKRSPETISLVSGPCYIDNIVFANAFIGVGTPEAGANCGQSVIRQLSGFVHDTMVRIDGSLDIIRIENVHCFVPGDHGGNNYFRKHRKCFHIKRSDGTMISKSFMIMGDTFLLKEAAAPGGGLSTQVEQCWCEAMGSYAIRVSDGTRISITHFETTSPNAKALLELNNSSRAMVSECLLRDSPNSRGIVVNSGSGLQLTNSEIFGNPGFVGIVLDSAGHTMISNNYIHHCEVGVRATASADNFSITGNSISENNVPLDVPTGPKRVVLNNL